MYILFCLYFRPFHILLIANTTPHPKLCKNYAFQQNFDTKKLGEITSFYTM